jgi:hypothetical protein
VYGYDINKISSSSQPPVIVSTQVDVITNVPQYYFDPVQGTNVEFRDTENKPVSTQAQYRGSKPSKVIILRDDGYNNSSSSSNNGGTINSGSCDDGGGTSCVTVEVEVIPSVTTSILTPSTASNSGISSNNSASVNRRIENTDDNSVELTGQS